MIDADGWLTELDALFAATLARVPDSAFVEPAALPGWTTGHVVAHVHFNALALCRLTGWARTGVESPMYAGPAQRADEIERGTLESPERLRQLVAGSRRRFCTEFAALTHAQRESIVVTAQGRHIPAAELAWLRCRELGVHAVDLGVGTTFEDLPVGFTAALVNEIVTKRIAGGEGPSLAAWLTGRDGSTALERWL
jgi:maleylpyruvate isomerase